MEKKIRYSFKSLGTFIEIHLVIDNEQILEVGEILSELEKIYQKAMRTFSRFDSKSELTILNNSLGQKVSCSNWMKQIALKSLEHCEKTNGFFDPRIIDDLENAGYDQDFAGIGNFKLQKVTAVDSIKGNLNQDLIVLEDGIIFNHRMDFAGIVKGFVTDQVANFLRLKGIKNFLVDSGGDIYAEGHDANEDYWYIAIEGIDEQKLQLKLSGQAIATSGINRRKWEIGGQRRHHIINPSSPNLFSFDIKTVTIIASSTEQADVWAKVLFLAGKDKADEIAQQNNLKYVIINYRGETTVSNSLKENIC